MGRYDTIVEATQALKWKGYTEDFNLRENWLECPDGRTKVFYQNFHLDKVFRFEGMPDHGDEDILLAITSPRLGIKSVLVNVYSIYANHIGSTMMERQQIKR